MRKVKHGKGLSILTALIMVLSMLYGVVFQATPVNAAASVSNPRIAKDGTVTWDKVTFGNYYQSADGKTKTPIEWRVLSVNGNDAFLLADKALDYMPYYEDSAGKISSDGFSWTWETSSLRSWLNGIGDYASDKTAFINEAFTDDERGAIIETNVINDNKFGQKIYNSTVDKVYLLSKTEAANESYGFDLFGINSETRELKGTDYTILKSKTIDTDSNHSWWLRTPDSEDKQAIMVDMDGYILWDGRHVTYDLAVRPVLHVNLSSSSVKSAGTVSAKKVVSGTQEEISTETSQTTKVTIPGQVKITSAKNKKKSIVVKWKKIKSVSGYKVQYALDKKFTKGKKIKNISSASKTSHTIGKLKKGKTYYVRVRAYNKDSKGNIVSGKWSSVKKVKIKK